MRTLHEINKIFGQESEYIKATLWWIIVETPFYSNQKARISPDGIVFRIMGNDTEDEEYPKYDSNVIIRNWIEAGRPKYREDRVVKG